MLGTSVKRPSTAQLDETEPIVDSDGIEWFSVSERVITFDDMMQRMFYLERKLQRDNLEEPFEQEEPIRQAIITAKKKRNREERRDPDREQEREMKERYKASRDALTVQKRHSFLKMRRMGQQAEGAVRECWEGAAIEIAPMIYLLLGLGFDTYNADELLDKILTSIEKRTTSSTITQGRTADSFRIDYDPRCGTRFGIRSRLRECLTPAIDYERINTLLAPFILRNGRAFDLRNPRAARQIWEDLGKPTTNFSAFRSEWESKGTSFASLRPLTPPKRDLVVSVVLSDLQQRCTEVHPASVLLRNPFELNCAEDEDETRRVREWSLKGNSGVAAKLRDCFEDVTRSPEEYEDLVERVMYCYKKANPTEIYGSDITSSTAYEGTVGTASTNIKETHGQGKYETQGSDKHRRFELLREGEHRRNGIDGSEAHAQSSNAIDANQKLSHKDKPALAHLVGPEFASLDSQTLTIWILHRIEQAMIDDSDLILWGRTWDAFRISYHPTGSGVTSIRSRIDRLFAMSSDLISLEDLIAPFVAANHTAFSLSAESASCMCSFDLNRTTYRSEWTWKSQILQEYRPITWQNSNKVIHALVCTIRKHCTNINPTSLLLRDPQNLSGEQYADLIERTLHCFKRANPAAVFPRPESSHKNKNNGCSPNIDGTWPVRLSEKASGHNIHRDVIDTDEFSQRTHESRQKVMDRDEEWLIKLSDDEAEGNSAFDEES